MFVGGQDKKMNKKLNQKQKEWQQSLIDRLNLG